MGLIDEHAPEFYGPGAASHRDPRRVSRSGIVLRDARRTGAQPSSERVLDNAAPSRNRRVVDQ